MLLDEPGRTQLACDAFRDAVITSFAAHIDAATTAHAHHTAPDLREACGLGPRRTVPPVTAN
ncbi:hypothetical protein ACFVGY_17040 [Streptomyces sp. NPDC127106]|uniref:hypothetical protein n=1 Tax=Streptomyces sp. NPDC127106 TaxID=3345360 RepID=UPI00362D51C6